MTQELQGNTARMWYNTNVRIQRNSGASTPLPLNIAKDEFAMPASNSTVTPENKQPEKEKRLPVGEEFTNYVYRRYTILVLSAALCAHAYYFIDYASTAKLFVAGIAMGLCFALALFYRRDWLDITQFHEFVTRDHMQAVAELRVRRKLHSDVRKGCVYVLQDISVTEYCKIGKTTALAKRIGHFDTMLPFEVRVVHVIESKDCNALEAMLHRHFESKRVRGEWFALSDADIAWLLKLEAV